MRWKAKNVLVIDDPHLMAVSSWVGYPSKSKQHMGGVGDSTTLSAKYRKRKLGTAVSQMTSSSQNRVVVNECESEEMHQAGIW